MLISKRFKNKLGFPKCNKPKHAVNLSDKNIQLQKLEFKYWYAVLSLEKSGIRRVVRDLNCRPLSSRYLRHEKWNQVWIWLTYALYSHIQSLHEKEKSRNTNNDTMCMCAHHRTGQYRDRSTLSSAKGDVGALGTPTFLHMLHTAWLRGNGPLMRVYPKDGSLPIQALFVNSYRRIWIWNNTNYCRRIPLEELVPRVLIPTHHGTNTSAHGKII